MPSLKEIKGRIASVKSTRKITSAMKMVASSKLHHAQVAIQNMLPYETMLEHILKSFLAAEAEAQTIYDQERPVHRVALVVFSSNSSLCGGFNANVIKLMQRTVQAYTEELGEGTVEIYPIGRKVAEKARKLGYNTQGDYADLVRQYYYRYYDIAPFSSAHEESYHVAGYADAAFRHQFLQAIGDEKRAAALEERMKTERGGSGSLSVAIDDIDRLLANIPLDR